MLLCILSIPHGPAGYLGVIWLIVAVLGPTIFPVYLFIAHGIRVPDPDCALPLQRPGLVLYAHCLFNCSEVAEFAGRPDYAFDFTNC